MNTNHPKKWSILAEGQQLLQSRCVTHCPQTHWYALLIIWLFSFLIAVRLGRLNLTEWLRSKLCLLVLLPGGWGSFVSHSGTEVPEGLSYGMSLSLPSFRLRWVQLPGIGKAVMWLSSKSGCETVHYPPWSHGKGINKHMISKVSKGSIDRAPFITVSFIHHMDSRVSHHTHYVIMLHLKQE